MRDYKFRGRRLDTGEWVYGSLLLEPMPGGRVDAWIHSAPVNGLGRPLNSPPQRQAWMVNPETVGQYIGLKDKNNQEIYEGDIYRHKNKYYDTVHQVKWMPERACWNLTSTYLDEIEVTGTTGENPGLLEQAA